MLSSSPPYAQDFDVSFLHGLTNGISHLKHHLQSLSIDEGRHEYVATGSFVIPALVDFIKLETLRVPSSMIMKVHPSIKKDDFTDSDLRYWLYLLPPRPVRLMIFPRHCETSPKPELPFFSMLSLHKDQHVPRLREIHCGFSNSADQDELKCILSRSGISESPMDTNRKASAKIMRFQGSTTTRRA